jgi:parallel beta helix pectate lyase-like protein/pectate lyase-like protein
MDLDWLAALLEAEARAAIKLSVGILASLVPLVGCSGPRIDPPRERSPLAESITVSALPAATSGSRYYVDPKGLDAGPGTRRAPFRTIQGAADKALPGDTVIVRPGVYTGPERLVSVTRAGTPGSWITFLSERPREAVLDGRESSLEGWYFGPGVGYVRVEGFEIRNMREHGFDTYGGGVHDLLIARNHVHHIGRNCTDTDNGRTGASLGAGTRRVAFDANVWHDIGRLAPGENSCSPRTQNYQNHDHGIYVADADDITITNNVFYNFRRGWAIHRYFSRGSASRGLTIVNNTFAGQNPYREGQIILATPTTGLRIENNIFASPRKAALYFEDLRFPESSVRYNMVFQGSIKVGRPSGVRFEHNWENPDPKFTGETDFRLNSDSPAIDAGLSVPEIAQDADGVARPRGRGYDLGAYER